MNTCRHSEGTFIYFIATANSCYALAAIIVAATFWTVPTHFYLLMDKNVQCLSGQSLMSLFLQIIMHSICFSHPLKYSWISASVLNCVASLNGNPDEVFAAIKVHILFSFPNMVHLARFNCF